MKLLIYVTTLLISLLLAACGKEKEKPVITVPSPQSTEVAGFIRVDLEDCQKPELIREGRVFEIRNGVTNPVPMGSVEFKLSSGLSSTFLSGTSYGLVARQTCKAKDQCQDRFDVESAPRPLTICRTPAIYPRESLEAVGLTAAASIETAASFYFDIAKRQIPPIALSVLPSLISEFPDETLTKSDNMAYVPDFTDRPTIVLFPPGSASKEAGIWQGINLWESSWGVSHEYGHHIFANTAPSENHNRVYGAINEGFADGFAFYNYDGDISQTRGLDCLKDTRTVSEPRFTTGDLKQLGDEQIEILLSAAEIATPRTTGFKACETPSFQNIHTVGAVIIHGLDAIWHVSNPDSRAKAQILLEWARSMPPIKATRFSLLQAIATGIELGSDNRSLSPAQCDVIKRVFPGFFQPLTSTEFICRY